MALTDKLSAIGNAVRNKTGSSDLMTLDQMATAIDNIQIQQPFDLNAANDILKDISFACPYEVFNSQGKSVWPYNSGDYGATIMTGQKMLYYNVTYRSSFNTGIILPSVSLPEGYCIKCDYDVRWISGGSYGDKYGFCSMRLMSRNVYTDGSVENINIINESYTNFDNSGAPFNFNGTITYDPAGVIINDKTIKYPYFYISVGYGSANTRTDNLIYRINNFRVEPISQGE